VRLHAEQGSSSVLLTAPCVSSSGPGVGTETQSLWTPVGNAAVRSRGGREEDKGAVPSGICKIVAVLGQINKC